MSSGVTVAYNGNVIHQMAGNGNFKMNTSGAYMEGDVDVVVDVSGGGGGTLITKNITQNGTYNAQDDNADGYSQVNVSVSGGGGIELIPIQYIESVGGSDDNAAYFRTGLTLSDISKIIIDFSLDSVSTRNNIFGCRAALLANNTSGKIMMTNSVNTSASHVSISTGRHTIEWSIVGNGQYSFKLDDGEATAINVSVSSYNKNIYLMSASLPRNDTILLKGKLYSAKIYDTNGDLIMDLLPYRFKNSNNICLYDATRNILLTTENGRGVAGADVTN